MVVTPQPLVAKLPRDLIQFDGPLAAWKLTLDLPLGGKSPAEERSAAELAAGFASAPSFAVLPDGSAVSFRAQVDGAVTSKNTKYPRTELREMRAAAPGTPASWSIGADKARSMRYDVAVAHAPVVKPQVVCGQIHDAYEDILEIMYDGKNSAIVYRWMGKSRPTRLVTGYRLGTFFTLRVDVAAGQVSISVDGEPKATESATNDGCYFKAGCYTQSNAQIEKDPMRYGEVWIRNMTMTGSGA